MIKQTTWHPDTCDCVLIYEWDTEHPSETRVHTPVSGLPCDRHSAHYEQGGIAQHHQTVTAENQRKNWAVTKLHQAIRESAPDVVAVTDLHGHPVAMRVRESGVELLQATHPEARAAHTTISDIHWAHDADGTLTLTSPIALPAQHVAHIDADAIHGPEGRLK